MQKVRLRHRPTAVVDLRATAKSRHITALDGVRGFAVLSVVFGHWWGGHFSEDLPVYKVASSLVNSSTGVLIFFVMSGYLITSIIAREQAQTGRISIYNFYVRRTLRIMPAFYTFIAAMGILAWLGYASIPAGQFWSAGLYLWNYAHLWGAFSDPTVGAWWLGHTWSLAVEEQFYVLWPLILLFLRPRRAFAIGATYLAIAPVIRLATYMLDENSRGQIGLMFHARADSLLTGCLIGLAPYVFPAAWARVREAIVRRPVEIPALAVLVASNALTTMVGGLWELPFGFTVANIAVGVLLVAIIAKRDSWLARGLCWRPLVLVGVISYGLYLWQQPFTYHGADAPFFAGQWWSIPAAFGITIASYWLVEKPFLQLKPLLQRKPRPTPTAPEQTQQIAAPSVTRGAQ